MALWKVDAQASASATTRAMSYQPEAIQFRNARKANTPNPSPEKLYWVCSEWIKSISKLKKHLPRYVTGSLQHTSMPQQNPTFPDSKTHRAAARKAAPGLALRHAGIADEINARSEQARRGLDSAPRVLTAFRSAQAGGQARGAALCPAGPPRGPCPVGGALRLTATQAGCGLALQLNRGEPRRCRGGQPTTASAWPAQSYRWCGGMRLG